jgi:toxin ParE1/3/4
MKGYILSPAARGDLDAIWSYTAEKWGIDQAARYVFDIRDACQPLASDGLKKGRSADNIRAGYRKFSVGSHFIFYRISADRHVEVIRILHQRMDVQSHFDNEN